MIKQLFQFILVIPLALSIAVPSYGSLYYTALKKPAHRVHPTERVSIEESSNLSDYSTIIDQVISIDSISILDAIEDDSLKGLLKDFLANYRLAAMGYSQIVKNNRASLADSLIEYFSIPSKDIFFGRIKKSERIKIQQERLLQFLEHLEEIQSHEYQNYTRQQKDKFRQYIESEQEFLDLFTQKSKEKLFDSAFWITFAPNVVWAFLSVSSVVVLSQGYIAPLILDSINSEFMYAVSLILIFLVGTSAVTVAGIMPFFKFVKSLMQKIMYPNKFLKNSNLKIQSMCAKFLALDESI